jgi:2-(1,2-epoxy-1,2-dihydrophenyl)acetyl-CoA isomerase
MVSFENNFKCPCLPFFLKYGNNVACITLNRPEKVQCGEPRNGAAAAGNARPVQKQRHPLRVPYLVPEKPLAPGRTWTKPRPDAPKISQILIEHFNPIIKRIRRLEKPVVAAVNGAAAGAGANIALCCDIAVAAQSAYFMQAFSKVGLIPDSGGTFFLPRLVGLQKATALAMLGEKVTAEEAERIGMIYKWFPDADFQTQTFSIAHTLAQLPTRALALTKQAFHTSLINNYEDQLHDEELLQERAGRTADHKRAYRRFWKSGRPFSRENEHGILKKFFDSIFMEYQTTTFGTLLPGWHQCANHNEGGQSGKHIGQLWEHFFKENIRAQIPDKIGNDIYCVYTDYERDDPARTQPCWAAPFPHSKPFRKALQVN